MCALIYILLSPFPPLVLVIASFITIIHMTVVSVRTSLEINSVSLNLLGPISYWIIIPQSHTLQYHKYIYIYDAIFTQITSWVTATTMMPQLVSHLFSKLIETSVIYNVRPAIQDMTCLVKTYLLSTMDCMVSKLVNCYGGNHRLGVPVG